MAESILKLKVDNQEYNEKIDRARQGLLAMEQACRKVGGTLEVVEQADLDFVKALGQMSTASNTANGKVSELTKAFTDLQSQYNRLTSEEKSSPFGEALAQSLNQLKGRIQEGNKELQDIQNQLRGTTKESDTSSTGLQALADKFGLNIGQMAKFATACAAVSAAMQVCKDAFMSSETNVDNWGRTVEATKSIYESFCISLNNGSLDGWFSNMDRLIQKAKDAYNAIDELNTKMTIINPERVKVQGQIQKQKEIIRTKGKDSAEGKAAADEIKRLEPKLKDTYKQEAQMNFKAFRTEVDRKLAEAGINLDSKSKDLLMRSFSDTKAYDRIAAGAKTETRGTGRYNLDEYGHAVGQETTKTWKNTNQILLDLFTDEWRTKNSGFLTAGYNAKMQSANVGIQDARYTGAGSGSGKTKTTTTTPKVTQKVDVTSSLTELQLLQDELKTVEASMSPFAKTSDDWKAMNEYAEGLRNKIKELNGELTEMQQGLSGPSTAAFGDWAKYLQDEMSTVDITTPLYQNLQAQLADTTALQNIIKTALENGISLDSINLDAEGLWDKILNAEDISNADWQGITDAINAQLKALGIDPIKLDVKTGNISALKVEAKESGDEFKKASQAVATMGGALSSLEDPGAKVAGLVAQAVASVAMTFAASLKGTFTPWDWIAAAAAGTATMISTIASIKSATAGSYADGGLIKGSSFTGDAVPIMANAGEIVLNYAQQSNIASALESKSEGGGGGRSTISGEQIVTVVNAYGRRTGRGEILR